MGASFLQSSVRKELQRSWQHVIPKSLKYVLQKGWLWWFERSWWYLITRNWKHILCPNVEFREFSECKVHSGSIKFEDIFMGNYVHTNVCETVSMKWKVIAAYLSGNLQSWEQENKSQKKQNDCCHGNSATSVILCFSWCTFLVPSLKNTAPIFPETFLI